MRRAEILVNGIKAATLVELDGRSYEVIYNSEYTGSPISLTMPVRIEKYHFAHFPPFFEGLLPEGGMLEALLRTRKIDRDDLFSQLITVGDDLVGHVTVREIK